MKKLFLFAILALSINAFAQNKQPILNLQHQPSKSMEDAQGRMDKERNYQIPFSRRNSFSDVSKIPSGTNHRTQTTQPFELIQIYDSIYYWSWDVISLSWEMNLKSLILFTMPTII